MWSVRLMAKSLAWLIWTNHCLFQNLNNSKCNCMSQFWMKWATFQYIHTLPQYLPFVQNCGMHLCCLNNRMNECCVFVVPTGATVLCHTQDGRVKDNIPIAQWAVTRGLGELESNFGNLDILLCTSHTENWAEHILSHQKTRNSVNTSTAAVRNYKWKEQTCQNVSEMLQ